MEYCLQEQPDSHCRFQYLSGRRKNRILFTFADCPLNKRMNPSHTNSGGYRASGLQAFREGTGGSGAGDKAGVTTAAFMNALKAQIGNVLYAIRYLDFRRTGARECI
ncbi:MAG: hypothetical protein LBD13_03420 [Spirochaetaceae bacterium]|jgi:hypothetical protein|nr:hypothetical protein [Spirochaetaceae bacterium]